MSYNSALTMLSKYLPDISDVSDRYKTFKSNKLLSYLNSNKIEFERLSRKLMTHNCYIAEDNNTFYLRKFTIKEVNRQFDFLYHTTNVSPDIILSKGLKVSYSTDVSKGFPPLLFLSTKDNFWQDYKYTYRVEIHQNVYYDTNLNHQCRNTHWAYCVKNKIQPKYITLYITR